MQINIVIGNPPYNNDMYIPFVEMGHQLATDCSLFITPAKWQAKGGEKNEQFRQNIVPHMSKIVYYPDCTDIFVIQECDGISYYLIDKNNKYSKKHIANHCTLNKNLESDYEVRDIDNCLLNFSNKLINKIMASNKPYRPEIIGDRHKYKVYTNNSLGVGGKNHKDSNGRYTYLLSNQGNMHCISLSEITKDNDMPNVKISCVTFSSDIEDECKSFISWTYTRLVRFLYFSGLLGRNLFRQDIAWRFVPDPGAFDHIFTDEELYKKYNLTDEEINIIESVIKERK